MIASWARNQPAIREREGFFISFWCYISLLHGAFSHDAHAKNKMAYEYSMSTGQFALLLVTAWTGIRVLHRIYQELAVSTNLRKRLLENADKMHGQGQQINDWFVTKNFLCLFFPRDNIVRKMTPFLNFIF